LLCVGLSKIVNELNETISNEIINKSGWTKITGNKQAKVTYNTWDSQVCWTEHHRLLAMKLQTYCYTLATVVDPQTKLYIQVYYYAKICYIRQWMQEYILPPFLNIRHHWLFSSVWLFVFSTNILANQQTNKLNLKDIG
jgi:hypothetical protein